MTPSDRYLYARACRLVADDIEHGRLLRRIGRYCVHRSLGHEDEPNCTLGHVAVRYHGRPSGTCPGLFGGAAWSAVGIANDSGGPPSVRGPAIVSALHALADSVCPGMVRG